MARGVYRFYNYRSSRRTSPVASASFISRFLRRSRRRFREWWRAAPDLKRDLTKLGAALCVVVLLVLAMPWFGKMSWSEWRKRGASSPARASEAGEGHRAAMAELRRETAVDPGDPRGWREAVGFLARIAASEPPTPRPAGARPEPGDVGVRVALVTEALQDVDLDAPRGGLGSWVAAGRLDPAFWRLAAAVAMALGRAEVFDAGLAARVNAAPADAVARFELAAFRLWSADAAVSRAAAAELVALERDPVVRLRAALERLAFVFLTRDPARVEAEVAGLSSVFQTEPGGAAEGWEALLAGLQTAAGGEAEEAARLARWLGEVALGARALAWVDGLSLEVRKSSALEGAVLELAARLNDLPRVRHGLESGAWGVVPGDAIQLALAARVQRLRFGEPRARATWDDAITTAMESADGLRALARLAGQWGDRDGADRALQALVERHPAEAWACEALRVSYSAQRDLDKLWRLYQAWAPRVPENRAVQRTWILLGALLNRSDAGQLARAEALLRTEPGEPATGTVLAVAGARWRAGRPAEATALLERLAPEAREEPRVVLWEAIFAAERDDAKALAERLAVLPRERLMREEQALLGAVLSAHERRKREAGLEVLARAEAEAAGEAAPLQNGEIAR